MTQDDRDAFLNKISAIDQQVEDATAEAGDDPLVTQIGNLAKAMLLTLNAQLYQAAPVSCLCCDRPATVRAGDWDLCQHCYNQISTPWPGLDECWGELQELTDDPY